MRKIMPKALSQLIEGYQEFRKQYFDGTNVTYEKLVRGGQRPKILMIACSDSRVDPAIVTKTEPGDLFVIRNVANLVPPYEPDNNTYHGTSAALEFAICTLGIKHLIVFGHTQCGGITALLQGANNPAGERSFIAKWMELAAPAHARVLRRYSEADLDQQVVLCEQYALTNSLKNLMTFPWIKQRAEEGSLSLHAWYFDLSTGTIQKFDAQNKCFVELK
jgi:carbonic anhydrase